jgi:hypothetical protein
MKTNLNLSSNPQYREAIAVQDKLSAALNAETGREQDLVGRLNSLLSSNSQADELQIAIDLANGHSVAPGNNAITEAISSSREKQQALSIGIEKQQHNILTLISQLSHEHCTARRAEHVAIAERIRTALEQVKSALEDEQKLRAEITGAGYRDGLERLHTMTFIQGSAEAETLCEVTHYCNIHNGSLSTKRNVTGIALSNFEMFGASGQAGQPLTVSEVTGELLRHHGKFDPSGGAVKASRIQQLAGIVG